MRNVEFGGFRDGYFRRNIVLPLDHTYYKEKGRLLKEYHYKDVYQTILERWPEEEKLLLYGPVYLDLDAEDLTREEFEKAKFDAILLMTHFTQQLGISEKEIQLYFSGGKGFHILLRPEIFNLSPREDMHLRHKAYVKYLKSYTMHDTLDTKIYDDKRLFRIANTINAKTGLYKIPLSFDELRTINEVTIRQMATNPRLRGYSDPTISKNAAEEYEKAMESLKPVNRTQGDKVIHHDADLLPCVEDILDTGASKGSRNNTSVALASSILQTGKTPEETIHILEDWNERNDPPMVDDEVKQTVKSAWSHLNNGKTYGCGYFQDLGYCQEGCKLLKR